jgi:hypothetical protein
MSAECTTSDDPSESQSAQTGQSLLRRGWSVGKKVAVASAAISVAPVVIPPLLMFSAFGLALSVPFGIYYAGLVGTERLMQSLLPLRQDEEVAQGILEEGADIMEEEKGYSDERDFKSQDNWEWEEEDEIVVQGEGYVGTWNSKTEENGGEQEDNDAIVEVPGEIGATIEEQGEMNKDYGVAGYLGERDEIAEKRKGNDVTRRGLKHEKEGKTEDDVVVETVKDKVDVVEETGGMKRDDTRVDTENNKGPVEKIIDITSASVDKDSVTMVKIEIKPDEAKKGLTDSEKGNTEMMEDKGMVKTDTGSHIVKTGENESSAVGSEGVDELEVEGKSDMADSDSQSSVERVGEVSNARASASSESSLTSDVEVK